MIEKLKESGGKAFGFKVTGRVTADEVKAFEPQIEMAIGDRGKRTIGILADLSAMTGAEWAARWEEIKFLSKYAEHIERVAIVGAHKWENVKAEILAGTVLVQAETRYYHGPEIAARLALGEDGRSRRGARPADPAEGRADGGLRSGVQRGLAP